VRNSDDESRTLEPDDDTPAERPRIASREALALANLGIALGTVGGFVRENAQAIDLVGVHERRHRLVSIAEHLRKLTIAVRHAEELVTDASRMTP
jgi:hypothetical protein